MAANQYLDSVLNILPAVQARQISELLQDLQKAGTIRNTNEYSKKLQELSFLLNDKNPSPSFVHLKALVWSLCSSDVQNRMIELAKNDIDSSFLQIEEIGSKLEDHYFFFINNLFSSLEQKLNQQENKIKELEWLANLNNEFSFALVNSFNSNLSFQVPRNKETENLYFDNRTFNIVPETELPSAVIDFNASKLVLNTEQDSKIFPIEVTLHADRYSYDSKVHKDISSDLNNLIDGKPRTYWYKNTYLEETVSEVTTVLEFKFGISKDINSVTIEGASSEQIKVKQIQAVVSGNRVNLISSPFSVNGTEKIFFDQVNASSVFITFSTSSFKRSQYFTSPKVSSLEFFDPSNVYEKLIRSDSLSSLVRDTLSSSSLIELCNVPETKTNQIDYYVYSLGLDNVYFGLSLYKNSGIFVSSPLKVKDPGVIAVSATENIFNSYIKNSIEYELVRIDNFPKYNETKVSIPKLGQTEVSNERLVLDKSSVGSVISDVGSLRFLPYVPFRSSHTQEYISVYENDVLLDRSKGDWSFSISNEGSSLKWENSYNGISFSDYEFNPTEMFIKIRSPKFNSIYTVSYTIRTSDTRDTDGTLNKIWLDTNKTVSLYDKGRVMWNRTIGVESKIYLQITLRRNQSQQSISPELVEYILLASNYE